MCRASSLRARARRGSAPIARPLLPEVSVPDGKSVLGITLITVPTIVYGGLTVLGVVSSGRLGLGRPLSPEQTTLFRAGHAHAGLVWALRLAAPLAAICVSGGFFGVAFLPAFRGLLYTGAALVALATLGTGVGLIRS